MKLLKEIINELKDFVKPFSELFKNQVSEKTFFRL